MKRRTASFSSFGSLRGMNYDLLRDTPYSEDWVALEEETRSVDKLRKEYRDVVDTLHRTQQNITSSLKSYKNAVDGLEQQIAKDKQLDEHMRYDVTDSLQDKRRLMDEVHKCLPQKTSFMLQLSLGDINVTLPRIGDRMRYKTHYENFKLKMTVVGLIFTVLLIATQNQYRIIEFLFHVFLAWYYCTIQLREHILIANGSRIRPWWIWHHYYSIVLVALLVIWPDGYASRSFYPQFNWFCLYVGLVQFLEFQYQRRRLYTLRALGKADAMQLSAEGAESWQSNLTYLIPFLLFGHLWQLYCAVFLALLWHDPECMDWQVPLLAVLFTLLGMGNIYTTMTTWYRKILHRAAKPADSSMHRGPTTAAT